MKAKESAIARTHVFSKSIKLTLDDVNRLENGNRMERRLAKKVTSICTRRKRIADKKIV